MKKDTERIDEIRAIKRAWEEAEPGRAARAAASRQKFLEENMIRVKEEEEEEEAEVSQGGGKEEVKVSEVGFVNIQ